MRKIIIKHKLLFHLVIVLSLQFIFLSIQIKDAAGRSLYARIIFGALTPIQSIFKSTIEVVDNFWTRYIYLKNVTNENIDLKKKIEKLEQQLVLKENLERHVSRLEYLLKFQKSQIFKTEAVMVIGEGTSTVYKTAFLNKGSNSGIQRLQTVINNEGVVGKIITTGPFTSQVQLLTDANSAVAIITETSRARGILRGSGGNVLKIDYIDKLEKVKIGEKIITTGLDQIFPPNLTIGWISDVKEKDELFLDVIVTPAVNFKHLENVLVLTEHPYKFALKQDSEITTDNENH